MNKLLLLCGLCCSAAFAAEIAKLPMPAPCGTLVDFVKTMDAQRFVDLEKAATAGDDKPAVSAPDDIIVEKEPEGGMCFAIFTFKVDAGRTLSKFDFILESDNSMTQSCIDMGRVDGNFYDFRLNAQEGPEMYKLIFHCPKDAYEVRLKSAFPNISLPPMGDFVVNERPAPPPAPTAPAETPAATAAPAEAPAATAAPAEAPAAK